jgi:hypothetical protein
VYRRRYLEEMATQDYRIGALADQVAAGETITLLCSSHCTDGERCHRTLLKELIEGRITSPSRGSSTDWSAAGVTDIEPHRLRPPGGS